MPNLSLNELKLIAKSRGIKGFKGMSKRLLSALDESKLAESKNNCDTAGIKKFKKDCNKLMYGFSKSKIKKIEQNLTELEESLSKLNKYYDYDDTEYQRIRDVANFFNEVAFKKSANEDYYKPIWTKSAFNGNFIEYERKGDKNKNVSPKEYLDLIRLRKFENRRNNICLIPLLDARSFSRWCTIFKMFEIPA